MTHRLATPPPALWRSLLLAAAVVVLAACSSGPSPDVRVSTIELTVSQRANRDAPIAVDMVMVRKEELVDTILGLTAADWFAQRSQFRRDYPRDVEVISWEVVPGQTLIRRPIDGGKDLWAAVVFANYLDPGPHRLRVDGVEDVTIRLGEETLSLVP